MHTTILLLEADVVLRELLNETLSEEGFNVITAATLPELIAHTPGDAGLLITELIRGSEVIGVEAIDQIRQHTRVHLPAMICTTARKQLEDLMPEIERRGVHLLQKPFTIDELIDRVGSAIRASDVRRMKAA